MPSATLPNLIAPSTELQLRPQLDLKSPTTSVNNMERGCYNCGDPSHQVRSRIFGPSKQLTYITIGPRLSQERHAYLVSFPNRLREKPANTNQLQLREVRLLITLSSRERLTRCPGEGHVSRECSNPQKAKSCYKCWYTSTSDGHILTL